MIYEKTNEEVDVKSWNICFDEGKSLGKQNLAFEDGLKCIDQPILVNLKKTITAHFWCLMILKMWNVKTEAYVFS